MHNKKYLYDLRADFARIQNEVLARDGFSIRVDYRSLKAQQIEAEKNGDDFLANLSKRMPESYIGVISAHEENSLATEVKRYREKIQSKQHSLFQVDMRKKTAQEDETKFLIRETECAWKIYAKRRFRRLIDKHNEKRLDKYNKKNLSRKKLKSLNSNVLLLLWNILVRTGVREVSHAHAYCKTPPDLLPFFLLGKIGSHGWHFNM